MDRLQLVKSPTDRPISRREMLLRGGSGIGLIGLATALQEQGLLGSSQGTGLHHPARAQRVIFLCMNGAPSHVDTFDPKPALADHAGQQPGEELQRASRGSGYMPSPFRFAAHGSSGVVMSELFPNLARHADDLCVLRSMHTDNPNHEPGLLMMHCGNQQPIRPSLGSWIGYGLGSENANLPGFVVLSPGRPVVGPQLWSNSFLPSRYQGMSVDTTRQEVGELVAHLQHPRFSSGERAGQLELLQRINRRHLEQRSGEAELEGQIQAMETAFRMQFEASEAFDIRRESATVTEAYGQTAFGRSCLLARRLVERGVRFVEVCYVSPDNKQPWDTHKKNNQQHRELCADSDRATAALLGDLKQRGLLDDTLVVWGGEFGRTPYAQNDEEMNWDQAGRDHHHTGFSMLLAGGGVQGGLMYGATDELGMHAVENRMHVHDLHATILHLMGIDHTGLTYRYSGRDFRLTDVHGRVVHDVLA